jgi:uncharacterized protein (DUF1697 family)/tetratricopeptide (TPR) repeat protein
MTRYVAFLRAINVGGHVVKMDHLRTLVEQIGFANVKTFIASGNVLFESSAKNPKALEDKIAKGLGDALGYEVAVFIRTAAEVGEISAHGGGSATEGSLFIGFLPTPLDAREKKMVASLRTPVDDLRVHKREIYWRATQNFRGALFQPAKLEKLLAKPATFRNVTTVRRIAALLAKPLLALAMMMPLALDAQVPALPPSGVVAHRVTVVREWVDAVLRHVPGETDAALLVTSTWNAEDLRDAWLDVNVLNALLRRPAQGTFEVQQWGRRVRVEVPRQDLVAMRAIATALIRRPGADVFRKRAAIFHMDAAMLLVGDSADSTIYSSFLLPRRIVVRAGDGEQEALHGGDVNWEFARVLLDAVRQPGDDLDVRLWYQATLAYKLAREQLDTPHFDRALELFPKDANILFLNGALHDALADPRVQAVVRDAALPRGVQLEVESEAAQLRKAAGLFRRALEADPAHVESAVRYARILGRLGQHADAAIYLRAIEDTTDPVLTYHAQLFLGVEEEALGRYEDARTAYEKALALFPRAQAPHLALSQLWHRTGDRVAARVALAPVLQPYGESASDDPWWIYRMTAGRQAHDLIAAAYRTIAPAGSP